VAIQAFSCGYELTFVHIQETHEQRAEKLKQTKLAALNLIAMLGMDKPDLTSISSFSRTYIEVLVY